MTKILNTYLVTNLTKLNRLPWHERWLLFQSLLFLTVIHLGLNFMGYSRLQGAMKKLTPLKTIERKVPESLTLQRAQRIARIVSIASEHGLYKAGCLRKSLLIWWLLRRGGVLSEICFGVRVCNQKLEAHAWVEYHEMVVNDSVNVRERYQILQNALPSTKVDL